MVSVRSRSRTLAELPRTEIDVRTCQESRAMGRCGSRRGPRVDISTTSSRPRPPISGFSANYSHVQRARAVDVSGTPDRGSEGSPSAKLADWRCAQGRAAASQGCRFVGSLCDMAHFASQPGARGAQQCRSAPRDVTAISILSPRYCLDAARRGFDREQRAALRDRRSLRPRQCQPSKAGARCELLP